ncbi:hypothetical protein M422DRAFT_245257 [Sphaerobolus stellatus SS14]|nr:hypothetical protein M422DRAFT_245257 [Sphaerobolus stellatus SS14]
MKFSTSPSSAGMPPPRIRAKQAKLQRSSGDTGFNSGILETISEASIDPSYVYEVSNSDIADLNESDDDDWAFSFINDMDKACEISDSSGDEEESSAGGKRKKISSGTEGVSYGRLGPSPNMRYN